MSVRIVFIVYPGVTLLDVTGPAQVFSSANTQNGDSESPYEVIVASERGGLLETDTGIRIETIPISSLDASAIDTIIVAGGNGVFDVSTDGIIVDWLRREMMNARRTVSTCMGVFLTAETGHLTGKRVTTHWRWCETLQQRYPELDVVAEPIYIKEDNYASSAGVTSGIDLALSLVEDDHGRETALAVAKNLVLYLKRTGGQSQFSAVLQSQTSERSTRFCDLNAWIARNLDSDLRIERLAERAGMSPRSFSRTYATTMNQTPAKAVEQIRFEKAKVLLETADVPIKKISSRCGFRDYERMRRTFVRQIGITPNEYRNRFGR